VGKSSNPISFLSSRTRPRAHQRLLYRCALDPESIIERCYSGMKRISTIDRERDLILATLNQCGGSRSQVCKTLGINRLLLKKKLDQYAAQGFKVPPSPKGWIVREWRRAPHN
jgi:transcriptional regulator of acetoin/glycerol metabolism